MPSIRGRGPHDLIVQPKKYIREKGGKVLVDDGPPVWVRKCDVQSVREWATSEEDLSNGIKLLSLRRVFARRWPFGPDSHVYFKGDVFEIVGDAQEMDRSKRTAHWLITIRRIGPEVPPVVPKPAP